MDLLQKAAAQDETAIRAKGEEVVGLKNALASSQLESGQAHEALKVRTLRARGLRD